MNKIVASLGLVAIGASGLQAVYAADDLGAPASKPWNVQASLRGFYDDNLNTVSSGANKEDTFGLEVAPGVGLNWERDATSLILSYLYSFKLYDVRPAGSTDKFDQSHMFNLALQHSFSPRYQIGVSDSFVVGQEPDQLRVPLGGTIDTAQRVSGDNFRNYGNIVFDAQLTPVFSLEANYGNTWFDYDNEGGNAVNPSNSGLLDRIENLIGLEGHWLLRPVTTGLIGYKYGMVNYTGDETIGVGLQSDDRNSRSHYGYLGLIHSFRPELQGSVRAGVQVISFINDPSDETDYSPYISLSLKHTYAPESHWDIGFSQSRSTADVVGQVSLTDFVRDTDVSLVYGSIYHRIAPRLYGSLIGTFQHSTFNGGSLDGDTQQYFQVGVNLQYRFNSYFSSEVGYNFDHVSSDVDGGDYDRNRVYLGVSATY